MSEEKIEILSWGGVEGVRRHPATRAELALVAKIDHLADRIRNLREALRRISEEEGGGFHASEFAVQALLEDERIER